LPFFFLPFDTEAMPHASSALSAWGESSSSFCVSSVISPKPKLREPFFPFFFLPDPVLQGLLSGSAALSSLAASAVVVSPPPTSKLHFEPVFQLEPQLPNPPPSFFKSLDPKFNSRLGAESSSLISWKASNV